MLYIQPVPVVRETWLGRQRVYQVIEEQGRIVAVETGAVWVETLRQSSCQSCAARSGCGHRMLDAERAGNRAHVRALYDGSDHYQVGDEVVIGLPEQVLVRGALMVYLIPLVLLIAGALVGTLLQESESAVRLIEPLFPVTELPALSGVIGLLAGFAVNRMFSRRYLHNRDWQPAVLRRQCIARIPFEGE